MNSMPSFTYENTILLDDGIYTNVNLTIDNVGTITNPIIITSVKGRGDSSGYKIEPWMKTTTEDMFIIHMNNVITMTETNDLEMIMIHQSFVRRIEDMKNNRHSVSRKMGYIANVNDAKELLEKIYKNS